MGVFLAPMAGITDLPFRLLAREFGADLVVSEMVSAQALVFKNKRTLQMLRIHELERPVAIQLFGNDPEIMAQGAQIALEYCAPEMIDLNFGCPTPKVVKNGKGAALLKTPKKVGEIAKAVVEAVPIPVTAKIRLGWNQESINCLEISRRLEEAGVKWITVHGRSRDQFYAGQADWEWIAKIKAQSSIPIVGNGDVFSVEDAQDLLKQTNCEHIAVGRGARGNPWIFQRIKAWLEKKEVLDPPTVEERVTVALRHLRMKMKYAGEKRAVLEMRPHLAWYLKGLPAAAKIRAQINKAKTYEEVLAILKNYL